MTTIDKGAVLENLQGMLREQREEQSKAQALREYPRLLHLLVVASDALRSNNPNVQSVVASQIDVTVGGASGQVRATRAQKTHCRKGHPRIVGSTGKCPVCKNGTQQRYRTRKRLGLLAEARAALGPEHHELALRIDEFLRDGLETSTDLEWTRLPSGDLALLRPEVKG